MRTLSLKAKTETAFNRIFEPLAPSFTGFQWVYRMFNGTLKDQRVSVVCGSPVVVERSEDNTPWLWNIPVTIEVVTPRKHVEQGEHDEWVAQVAEHVYDGTGTCAALNAAMAGEGFTAHCWMFGDGPECEADDKLCRSKLTGNLLMRPVDAGG